MRSDALVSIIIPCYNQGKYITSTLSSALEQTYKNIEIVLIDDGSTDPETIKVVQSLRHERLKVYRTKNRGVSAARNYAIAASHGEYILPLDGDDRIAPSYVEKAMEIAMTKGSMCVVYCEAAVFGEINMKWKLAPYSLRGILRENMVFCSALFSKRLFKKIGGYNLNMRTGWEDWDFWLSAIEKGATFHRLREVLFFYRMVKKSRNASLSLPMMKSMYAQLFRNHRDLFMDNIEAILDEYVELKEEDRRRRNQPIRKIVRRFKMILRKNSTK